MEAIVDSGAEVSVARVGLFPDVEFAGSRIHLVDAQGTAIKAFGEINLCLQIGSNVLQHPFVVADVTADVLLGMDFLSQHGALVDFGNRSVHFANEKRGDQMLADGYDAQIAGVEALGAAEKLAPLEDLWTRSCEHLSEEQCSNVWRLLLEFQDVFSLSSGDLGKTALVKHTIDTGQAVPIKQAPRRLPLAKQEWARQELVSMQEQGIIEPGFGPWAAPVVLVDKKDGSQRFCVDFRRLNEVTKKDSYPLPRIDAILDALGGSSWFSTLDLKSGYWQIEMDAADREKTAFSMDGGLWQFKVMPFGLCNAPATFERLMEMVMSGMPKQALLVYLDDLIVHADGFDQELSNLRDTFTRLRNAGLKLSPKKCHLFKRETSFLGHIVSAKGLATDPEKATAVVNWPQPRNTTDVRSFLGLCAYYRRFVKDFAIVARPLYELTGKNRKFLWSIECGEAFNKLKLLLTNPPILRFPNLHKEFVLDTDASQTGIGAVLSQVDGEEEYVLAYFSRLLSKAERRYCTTRRELLAIVKSLTHFHPYLYGHKFTLRTDHASLRWLVNFRDPEGQLARWLQRLQQYDFKVIHRPGSKHGNADGLSRRPCEEDMCRYCCRQESLSEKEAVTATVNFVSLQGVDLAASQRTDSDLAEIINLKQSGSNRPSWSQVSTKSPVFKCYWSEWETLELANDVLHRRWHTDTPNKSHLLPVIPKDLQGELLRYVHDNPSGGHFGRKKTLSKVKDKYYWINRRRTVNDWCRNCTVCATRKGPKKKQHGPAQLYVVGAPMERIAVDILGPLPVTDLGNKYMLVAMDYFTKWPEVYAIPDQEATTIARVLVEGMFSRFGAPLELHSDQGRNFESAVFAEVCRLFGVNKTRTTPGYPQSDGMVERFNRTLLNMLASVSSDHQRDWDIYLPFVLLAYRTAENEATGVSPSYAMLGREVRGPVDLLLPRPQQEDAVAITGYGKQLRGILEEVHSTVRENLQASSNDMKNRYDRRADVNGFQPGDAVWLYNPRVKRNLSPKLSRPWEGPYKVIERLTDVVYRIQRGPRTKSRVVNRFRLWRVSGDLPVDWWETGDKRVTNVPDSTPVVDDNADNDQEEDEKYDEAPTVYISRSGRTVRKPCRY